MKNTGEKDLPLIRKVAKDTGRATDCKGLCNNERAHFYLHHRYNDVSVHKIIWLGLLHSYITEVDKEDELRKKAWKTSERCTS